MNEFLKRLPVIRHIRYYVTIYKINRHYYICRSMGMIPWYAGDDYAEAQKIWEGKR